MNHACTSNTHLTWEEDTLTLEVRTTTFVSAGEELTTTLTDPLNSRELRRLSLANAWHFTCTCPCCSLPGSASAISDANRTRIRDWQTLFERWDEGPSSGVTGISVLREGHILLRKGGLCDIEQLWGEPRAQMYSQMGLVARAHGS
jgi:hypothetical protein